jgi:hypothetical protein
MDAGACTAVKYANELHAAVERLAIGLKWPMVLADGNVYLPTSRSVVGLAVNARLGVRVDVEFQRRGLLVPTVVLPGRTTLWAFVVSSPGPDVPPVPRQVKVVHGGQYLPLPPSVMQDGPVRWVREPGSAVPPFRVALDVLWHVWPTAVPGR